MPTGERKAHKVVAEAGRHRIQAPEGLLCRRQLTLKKAGRFDPEESE